MSIAHTQKKSSLETVNFHLLRLFEILLDLIDYFINQILYIFRKKILNAIERIKKETVSVKR